MARLPMLHLLVLIICPLIVLAGCSSSTNGTTNTKPPVVPGKDFVYTGNAFATVSALTTDRTTGVLTAIAGSPFSAGSGSFALAAEPGGKFLYVGNSPVFAINASTGALTPTSSSMSDAESLAVDPNGKFLYAVAGSENLWAYSIASTGALAPVSGFPIAIAPTGTQSNLVIMDPTGRYLYVTNNDSFSAKIYGFSRDTTNGGLTALAGFPVSVGGMANTAAFDPTRTYLLVTGTGVFGTLGGVTVFFFNSSTGALTPASPVQVGSDPSGVVVDAFGRFVYIPNTADATISAFTLNASGGLTAIAGSPFPSGGNGTINGPMGIATDLAGHFIYVCNASNDISVFSINATSGALSPITGSPFPDGGNGPHAIIFVKKP